MIVAWLIGCGGGKEPGNDYAEDFAYARECDELCTPEDLTGFAATCGGEDPDEVQRACGAACEEVLTGKELACASCILDESSGWDGADCDSGDTGEGEACRCDVDWYVASPTDCVKACS